MARTGTQRPPSNGRPEDRRGPLTASEIAEFVFCPEAWYLRRFGHTPDVETVHRLHDGTRKHEHIGQTAERIVYTDRLRRGLLMIVIALAALLLATSTGLLSLPGPGQ